MNLINAYIEYRSETEPPVIYHRWSMIASIGALLGRRFYIPFGSDDLYPNVYVMFIGSAGSRKSTAIKGAVKIIAETGYDKFSARKTSKEKFLMDLSGVLDKADKCEELKLTDNVTETNLFGNNSDLSEPKEVFIAADEFEEFATGDKKLFYDLLGDLWDWDNKTIRYTSRIKGSDTGGDSIYQPTISILGGTTPETFAQAFPPEIIGRGFMSRLLIIYGERSERMYHKPKRPDSLDTEAIVNALKEIKDKYYGECRQLPELWDDGKLMWQLYRGWQPIGDVRFRAYANRRYTNLIKLSLIHAAALGKSVIDEEVIILTNTVLSAAERNMVKALGEFGKNKDSDVVNTILTMIREADAPVSGPDIWKEVRKDLSSPNQVSQILINLKQAEVIQHIPGKGWLPFIVKKDTEKFVDWSLLTKEEQEML